MRRGAGRAYHGVEQACRVAELLLLLLLLLLLRRVAHRHSEERRLLRLLLLLTSVPSPGHVHASTHRHTYIHMDT